MYFQFNTKVLGFTPISLPNNKYKRLNSSNYRYYRIFNKSSTVSLSELSCSETVPVNNVLVSTPFQLNISSFRLDLNYTTDREDTSKVHPDDHQPEPNDKSADMDSLLAFFDNLKIND